MRRWSWLSLGWRASVSAAGLVAALLSGVLAWLGSIYEPRRTITLSLFWLVGTAAAALFITAAAIFLAVFSTRPEARRVAGIRAVAVDRWTGDASDTDIDRVILLLTPPDVFSLGSLVSIFHREVATSADNYERFAGLSVVQSLNQGRRPQVVVFHEGPGAGEIWQKVRARDAGTLQSMVIRPGGSYDDLAHWRRATRV